MIYYIVTDESLDNPIQPKAFCQVGYFSKRCLEKSTPNEDALLIIELDKNSYILAVADGAGGHPKGEEAAKVCLEEIITFVQNSTGKKLSYRNEILNAIESANTKLLETKTGSKTTVSVLEYNQGVCRGYQVGDSTALVCGQKGKIKFRSLSHSPVGYGVEAGLINDKEALSHPDLNIISNLVGDHDMKIEIGPEVKISKNDSLFIASDGLFDNFSSDQIVNTIRSGSPSMALDNLIKSIEKNIYQNSQAKQDDLTFIFFRPRF